MKRSSVTNALHRAWDAQTIYYATAAMLCVVSLSAQMTWRIPNEWLVRWLPWLGTLLFVVSLLVLVSHVVGGGGAQESDDAKSEVAESTRRFSLLRLAERLGMALVWLYVAYGGFVFVNATLDSAPPGELRARVERVSRHEVYVGDFLSYAWTTLRPSMDETRPMTLFLSARERPHRWGGEPVRVKMHRGLFRVAWVSEITRDEEALNRAILERLPDAAQPWHQLMRFYVERKDWAQAQTAARAYLKAYPAGYSDVLRVGNRLAVARDHARALLFYEAAFQAHQDYETYNLYGWTLSHVGRRDEAVQLLQAAIPLDDRQFWAYYHLGYVYLAMGKRAEALEMFHKVLERRPDFPEIQNYIARLGR